MQRHVACVTPHVMLSLAQPISHPRMHQVSALKPSGERLTMRMAFSNMLAEEQMRDAQAAHYEV